jgi:hypothetical protein
MDISLFITSALTSATVSGLLVFILKTYFKSRIEHTYRIELEKFKSQLALELGEGQAFVSRRVEGYSALVEMVYRTRNMVRDLEESLSSQNLSLVAEVASRTKELEELLYKYRIDLERDGQFHPVHRYKNMLLTFSMKASDVKYFIEHEESERAERAKSELVDIYEELEALYSDIVHELSVAEAKQNSASDGRATNEPNKALQRTSR